MAENQKLITLTLHTPSFNHWPWSPPLPYFFAKTWIKTSSLNKNALQLLICMILNILDPLFKSIHDSGQTTSLNCKCSTSMIFRSISRSVPGEILMYFSAVKVLYVLCSLSYLNMKAAISDANLRIRFWFFKTRDFPIL